MAKPKIPVPADLALEMAHVWTERALFQGRRLQANLHRQFTHNDDKASPDERAAYLAATFVRVADGPEFSDMLESFFFLVALRQILRWLAWYPKKGADAGVSDAARDFEASTRDVADVRDMLEHEDEYLVGGGNKKEAYEADVDGRKYPAHLVEADGPGHRFGGRLHSRALMQALENLSPVLWKARERDIAELRRQAAHTNMP